jgi:hypothetical protein
MIIIILTLLRNVALWLWRLFEKRIAKLEGRAPRDYPPRNG